MIIAITNLLITAFSFYKSITNSQAICGNAEVQIIWYTLWGLKLGWILLNRNNIFNIGTLQNSTWIGIFLTLALQINWNGRLSLSYIVCQSSNSLLTKLIFWYRNFCKLQESFCAPTFWYFGIRKQAKLLVKKKRHA